MGNFIPSGSLVASRRLTLGCFATPPKGVALFISLFQKSSKGIGLLFLRKIQPYEVAATAALIGSKSIMSPDEAVTCV
jgi:hypothetical protein